MISSPVAIPACCAGEPGATARTRAAGIWPGYGAGTLEHDVDPGCRASPEGAPRRTAGLLRRRGDGDQGARLDGASVRAARVLLPRDRAQPARGGTVPRAGRDLRRRPRGSTARRAADALGPWFFAGGGRRGARRGPLRGERGVPPRDESAPRSAGT